MLTIITGIITAGDLLIMLVIGFATTAILHKLDGVIKAVHSITFAIGPMRDAVIEEAKKKIPPHLR